MHRLRSTWMALMAGALLVTLSVSAAFGAAPANEEGNRGQSIAAFVHELVFGDGDTQDEADEELVEDEEELVGEEELADEALLDDELDTELDEDLDEETDAHGACVSEVAQDKDAIGGPNENHGGAVSEAARETCWETDEADEDTAEVIEEDEVVDEEEDEESDSHGACVSAAAQDREGSAESELKNHGKWVSQHARYTCWGLDVPTDEADEDGDEESSDTEGASAETDEAGDEPAEADRPGGKPSWAGTGGSGKPSWAGNGGGGGNGNGRGGARP